VIAAREVRPQRGRTCSSPRCMHSSFFTVRRVADGAPSPRLTTWSSASRCCAAWDTAAAALRRCRCRPALEQVDHIRWPQLMTPTACRKQRALSGSRIRERFASHSRRRGLGKSPWKASSFDLHVMYAVGRDRRPERPPTPWSCSRA
jgi:hypothetical protein